MSRQAEGAPLNIEELLGSMEERMVLRRLHELGDEGVALILEAAAIRAENPQVENAARDLRLHLMTGGTAATFLDKYPGHRGVNFNNLSLDITLAEVTQASLLLGTGRPLDLPGGHLREGRGVVERRSRFNSGLYDQAKADELFEKYSGIKDLFSDQERWTQDGQDKLVSRRQLQDLLVSKKPDGVFTPHYIEALITKYWTEWKVSNSHAGRRLKGRALTIFLTESETVNFLWFIHQKISLNKSPNRGISLAGFTPETPKKK